MVTLDSPMIQAKMTTRVNLAVQHLLAASHFSRKTHQLEREHSGEDLGSFFDEIIWMVNSTIILSVASLEANFNEHFADLSINQEFAGNALVDEFAEEIDRRPILEKYQGLLALLGKPRFDKGDSTFQDADNLVRARNALVHFTPEPYKEKKKHKKLEDRLRGKFDLSPFIGSSGKFFLQKCMSAGMADWSVSTVCNFTTEFAGISGLPDKYAQFDSRLETK